MPVDDAAYEGLIKPRSCWGWDYPADRYSKMAARRPGALFSASDDRPSGLDFSFSGLKTFAANTIRDNGTDDQTRADIARAFEDAVVDTLMIMAALIRRALSDWSWRAAWSANRVTGEAGGNDEKTPGGEVRSTRVRNLY